MRKLCWSLQLLIVRSEIPEILKLDRSTSKRKWSHLNRRPRCLFPSPQAPSPILPPADFEPGAIAWRMFKEEHPHFVTGNFAPQNVFLGDQEYGRALDCLVKACTDLLILDSERPDCKVLLGKRIVEPQPDWWYVGGRMKPGERPEKSMARLVKRELHLLVEPHRFQPLGTHSYAWARRQQAPMDHGTCDISVVLTLVLLPGEAERVHMDENEYAEFRWFSVSEIIAGESFHPALRASARDVCQRQSWQKLVREVRNGGSTESIAEAAKKLVN